MQLLSSIGYIFVLFHQGADYELNLVFSRIFQIRVKHKQIMFKYESLVFFFNSFEALVVATVASYDNH